MGVKTYDRYSRHVLKTARWKILRLEIIERDGLRCLDCGARGRLEVDHVKPVRRRPDLAYEPSNLRTLCTSCHTRKTRIECGHAPLDPRRVRWREFVADLENQSRKGNPKCSTV